MEINVKPIVHFEFEPPQRTMRTRLLLDRHRSSPAHVMCGEITVIPRQFWHDFFFDDRGRDIPRRVEQDRLDGRLKFRGLLVELADDNPGRKHRAIIAEQLKLRNRRVDDEPIGRHVARQPAQPLEIDRDLPRSTQRFRRADPRHRAIGADAPRPAGRRRNRQVFRISAAHRRVFRRCRGERLDRLSRIGGRDRSDRRLRRCRPALGANPLPPGAPRPAQHRAPGRRHRREWHLKAAGRARSAIMRGRVRRARGCETRPDRDRAGRRATPRPTALPPRQGGRSKPYSTGARHKICGSSAHAAARLGSRHAQPRRADLRSRCRR